VGQTFLSAQRRQECLRHQEKETHSLVSIYSLPHIGYPLSREEEAAMSSGHENEDQLDLHPGKIDLSITRRRLEHTAGSPPKQVIQGRPRFRNNSRLQRNRVILPHERVLLCPIPGRFCLLNKRIRSFYAYTTFGYISGHFPNFTCRSPLRAAV